MFYDREMETQNEVTELKGMVKISHIAQRECCGLCWDM